MSYRLKALSLIIAFLIIFQCAQLPTYAENAQENSDADYIEFEDVSHVSDQEFFGLWNNAEGKWEIESEINYSYSPNLEPVEAAVKANDYEGAKIELLEYYRNRGNAYVSGEIGASRRNLFMANLMCDNIFISNYSISGAEFNVESDWKEVSIEVPDGMVVSGSMDCIIMAYDRDGYMTEIFSKENDEHKPVLEATVNGVKKTFFPSGDTYVRAGDYVNSNFCTESLIKAQASGDPIDSDTYVGALGFKMGNPTDTITNIVLKLWSRHTGTGTKKMLLLMDDTPGRSEDSITWNSCIWQKYNYNGTEGGLKWNQIPGSNSEYINMLCRFNFLRPMTYEYMLTKNEKYAYNAIRLIMTFIEQRGNSAPTGRPPQAYGNGIYPRNLDAALRLETWLESYQYLIQSEHMTPGANCALLKQIWEITRHLRMEENYWNGNNWGLTQSGGLFMGSIGFPEFVRSSEWHEKAVERLEEQFDSELSEGGVYSEDTSNYSSVVFNDMTSLKRMAERNGAKLSDHFDDMIQKFAHYMMDMHSNAGKGVGWGDGGSGQRASGYLSFVADWYKDEALRYKSTFGMQGDHPGYTSKFYDKPGENILSMRSDWSTTGLHLFSEFRSGFGGHGHADDLMIVASAYGDELLIDNGNYTYDGIGGFRAWHRSTAAHNTVEINNTSQVMDAENGIDTNTSQVEWMTNDGFDLFSGETRSNLGFTHNRSIYFLKPQFWIVSDVLTPDETYINNNNVYKQNWHMLPGSNYAVNEETKAIASNYEGANIKIVPADSEEISVETQNGWYSGNGGLETVSNPTFEKVQRGITTYDTLLMPVMKNSTKEASVERIELEVEPYVASAIKIDFTDDGNADGEGFYYLSHERDGYTKRTFGDYSFEGEVAYIGRNVNGEVRDITIGRGSQISGENDETIISCNRELKDICVQIKDTSVQIFTSETITPEDQLTFVAPDGIVRVYINGNLTPFSILEDSILVGSGTTNAGSGNNTSGGKVEPLLPPSGENSGGSTSGGNSGGSTTGGNSGGSTTGGNSSGSTSGGNLGGSNTVLEPDIGSGTTVPKYDEFTDVDDHWAKSEIEELHRAGIINGNGTEFRPDDSITRAEFAAIIGRAFDLKQGEKIEFSDVNEGSWFFDAVSDISSAGIMVGNDGMFRPYDLTTREESAKILALLCETDIGTQVEPTLFADDNTISDWARKYVYRAVALGLFNGDNENCFRAKFNITRAETAAIVCRLRNNYMKEIDIDE